MLRLGAVASDSTPCWRWQDATHIALPPLQALLDSALLALSLGTQAKINNQT
jgi:hypothetical protein